MTQDRFIFIWRHYHMIEGNDNNLYNTNSKEDEFEEDSDSAENDDVTMTQTEYDSETNFWFKKAEPLVNQVSSKL